MHQGRMKLGKRMSHDEIAARPQLMRGHLTKLDHSSMTKPPKYRVVNQLQHDADDERSRLIAGLRAAKASVEPKYFYDPLGCALYAAICQLDEYYLTRTEEAIFQRHRQAIADAVMAGRSRGAATGGTLIDLGAGDCHKAQSWLPYLKPQRYLAVDIAAPGIEAALDKLAADFPEVEMLGLATDFATTLSIPADLLAGPRTMFYPGSSIGNFAPDAAIRFLAEMRAIVGDSGGCLLIGVDAKKSKARLDAAYDDALGVTAAFNLNVLRHLNRVLGSSFDCVDWRHAGFYNADAGRVEMHLEAIRAVEVNLDGVSRHFAAGERIHSENSYKYHRAEFEALLGAAGFTETLCWTDNEEAYWVFCAR